MDKPTLRQKLIRDRLALSADETCAASAAVCRHLATWSVFANAQTVLAYLAFGNEITLQQLIDDHPEKTWAVPRTLRRGRLSIRVYQPDHLVRHPWGMLEPAPDAPEVPLHTIDLVLVPGVGFDHQGGRMGFGGGYYDRLLPQLDAVRIGIGYPMHRNLQIPCDEHDCRMDWVAQPDGIIRAHAD